MTTTEMQGARASMWLWSPHSERPSLLLEQRAGLELAELFSNPVYYGVGVPRGDGSPVLLLPGFLGSDSYLTIMNGWLQRIGYRPHASRLTVMTSSPIDLIGKVIRRADEVATASGRPVTVIGHSMGGMMACLLAKLRPDIVSHVMTLGSPIAGDGREAAHPAVAAMAQMLVRERGSRSEAAAQRALERELFGGPMPDSVRLTCLYSREDAVVHWRACFDCQPHTMSYEVRGTHTGLAWNSQVYRHLGRALPEVA